VCGGVGMDMRIGRSFLDAGIGYGGFCFPKDLSAFIAIANDLGYDFRLLKEVEAVNDDMKRRFVRKIQTVLWNLRDKNVGVLGLAFKPNTDDMRFAPSIDIINALVREGAKVRAFDPQSMSRARRLLPDITYCSRAEDVADEADVLAVLTEWPEFRKLDLAAL
jgi:UDPglucose 6-dehydrogenase